MSTEAPASGEWPVLGETTEAVLRLLRGEEQDLLSREYGVVAARLSQWREVFLAGGQ